MTMDENTEWVIETRDLDRVYGDGDVIHALDKVNIKIAHGELVSVMGPSGSGKSTLLNVIGALDRPTGGEIYVNGQNLLEIKDLDTFRARSVGFIFQLHNLLPTMTSKENVEIPMTGHVASAAERDKRAKELLAMVGMDNRMNHLPGQLSGGQRQRVAIARALANNPPLVLADEPTGSLDTVNGQELMRLLRQLNEEQGTTFVVVTHDPAVARQTKRVLVMRDGKIEREDIIGSPDEEDLKMWRHTALGKQILGGQSSDLLSEKLSAVELKAVKKMLSVANGK
jgi:ABC-type lipoprotein export system ATPase subunit